jgi:hypothetical protein
MVSAVMLIAVGPVSAAKDEGVMNGDFSVVGNPLLNQEIEVTYSATPEIDVPNAFMHIELPKGVELLHGNITWTGSLEKGKRTQLKFRLKVVEQGKWQIDAVWFMNKSGSPLLLDKDVLIITTTTKKGKVVEVTNFQKIETTEEKLHSSKALRSKSFLVASEVSTTSTIQVTGRFTFEDADDGNIKKPIRNAVVKVKDSWGFTKGESTTDMNGDYSIPISISSPTDLYVQVWTDSSEGKVETTSTITYSGYTSTKTVDPNNPSTWDFGEYYADYSSYQWQIMYYTQEANHWIKSNTNPAYTMGKVTTIYPSDLIPVLGDWPRAVWYYILLPNKTTAYWDHYTVYHEYGHMVMMELYGFVDFPIDFQYENGYYFYDSCPADDPNQCVNGNHVVNSVTQPEFSIVEGWAEFMEAAVESTQNEVWYDNMGDVDGDGLDNWVESNVNIESNSYTATNGQTYKWYHGRVAPPNTNGNLVEGAAASIFWDIFDPANDDDLSMGFDEIFSILKGAVKLSYK